MNNFEIFLKRFKVVDIENGDQIEPSVVMIPNESVDDKKDILLMNSRVFNYNHFDCLGITKTMSKKLFQGFLDVWKNLIDACHNNSDNKFFNQRFIMFESVLIDYFPEVIPEDYDFHNSISNIIEDLNESNFRVRCNTNLNGEFITIIDTESTNSVIVICMNINKSYYTIHQGKYDNDGRILFFKKASTETDSLIEFIYLLNEVKISEQFEVLNSIVNELNDLGKINLSYRELLDFIKFSKIELIEDGLGLVSDLNNLIISEETECLKEKLIEALRVYPYKSLKKMNWLRKSLKFSDISTAELLKLFSDNLLNEYAGISPYLLADLYELRMESDNIIVKDSIKKE